jgi:hypothetical protein
MSVSCVNNATDALSGTYSLINSSTFAGSQARQYFNFNPNGTFTTALVHNDTSCNTGSDARNGNGVEYGVFNWKQSTGTLSFPVGAVVDTNGSCGLHGDPAQALQTFNVKRVGNGIELRETATGPLLGTATAVESDPTSLVGAFVPIGASDGELLVFHSDGTFLFAEVQQTGLYPLGYGQERGCYSVSGSTVVLTVDASCRPDGQAALDLNLFGGLFAAGLTTTTSTPFTIVDADTISIFGGLWKRTRPN